MHADPIWLFAAWVGLWGGRVVLLHEAPLHAPGFFARGVAGLTKTVLGAGRFLSTMPRIMAREREAMPRHTSGSGRGPYRRDPLAASRPAEPPTAALPPLAARQRRRDQQRAAA